MKKPSALITGGTRRIGKAIALSLAEKGYHIALHCHASNKEAETTAKEIKEHGVRCRVFPADLDQNDDMLSLIPNVLQDFPDLNLLINNASIFIRRHLIDTDIELFDRTWNINVKAPIFLSRDFADYRGEGHIINMLDTKISKQLISYFVYSLSKKTLAEFTKMAAKELGPKIRVNGICPGLILPSKDTSKEAFEKMGAKIPLQSTGDSSRIVSAVHFLIENTYITGETLFIDGGEHLM
jgi:pteridine reductase